jgi:hypothetical protein
MTSIDTLKEFAQTVFTQIGPGFSERIYHNAFEVLLRINGVQYETERIVPVTFENHIIGNIRADLIIENTRILELKAVKGLTPEMKTQLTNYLKLTGLGEGLVINFPQNEKTTGVEFLYVVL